MVDTARLVLAGGFVGAGFIVLQDLRTDNQAKRARNLLNQLERALAEETDNAGEVTDAEARQHIIRWESVARSYYALLEDEQRDAIPAAPDEFQQQAAQANTPQEEALLWKGYAYGVLQQFLAQKGGPGFDRDDFAGFFWELIKLGMLAGGLALVLRYIAEQAWEYFKNYPKDPDGGRSSARDHLGDSFGNWIDVFPDNPPQRYDDFFQLYLLSANLELGMEELFPEDPAPGNEVASGEMSLIEQVMPSSVFSPLDSLISIPSGAYVVVEDAAVEVLAAASNKDKQWWLSLGTATLIAACLAYLIASGGIVTPDPFTTATGYGLLIATSAWLGVSMDADILTDNIGQLRNHVEYS